MLAALVSLFLTYKYLALFPIAVLEGPIIAIVSGSLASTGHLNFLAAYILIVTGDLTGDTFYYLLGRFGRKSILKRWGRYVGLTEDRLQSVDRHYLKHAAKTLIIGKLVFSFEIPVIISAGLARFSFVRFITYMTISALPKTLFLMLIGAIFGISLAGARSGLAYAARVLFVIILAAAALVLMHSLGKRQWGPASGKHPRKYPMRHD